MHRSNSYIQRIISALIIVCFLGCEPEKIVPPADEQLRISVDAAQFVVLPGPEFDFSVIVESAMPSGGVNINFSIDGEKDGINYYSSPTVLKVTEKRSQQKVVYIPRQVMCVCTVKVVSTGNTDNKATTTFRLVYK
jgi:hypothetical protein